MISDAERRHFATEGYLLLPDAVPEALLAAADHDIDAEIARNPPSDGNVGPHFSFRPTAELPAADAALRESGVLGTAEELVAPLRLRNAFDQIQIALNIPPYEHEPGAPHLDGHRPEQARPGSFTMLAAVFLSDESRPDAGNLWVWPGSHLGHQQLFRERGVRALLPVSGHAVMLDPPVWFRGGMPILARRGDVLLAHFLLGHNTGGNTSELVRRILYYRLACEGHADRWADTFTDAFTEYEPLRPFAPATGTAPA